MRFMIGAILAALMLAISIPAYATDAGKADAEVVAPASRPASGPTMPSDVPKTTDEAMAQAKSLLDMAKAKQWFGFSAGAIWLFMFLFKLGRKSFDFMKKVPKRVLWILVPVLSIAAMVLAKLQADLSWGAAGAVLLSGPSVAFLNDMIKRGVMGKEPSSPVGGGVS